MKKGKVFGKGHAILALMVLALGAAVWLNMRLTPTKYLGEATYVNGSSSENAVETSAKVSKTEKDYFEQAKEDREKSRKTAQKLVEESLDSEKLTDEDKQAAINKIGELAARIERETNIETLLKAKSFEKGVAVIGDDSVTVVVKSDGLTTAQTLQIQDIVTGETGVALGNIKIVAVK